MFKRIADRLERPPGSCSAAGRIFHLVQRQDGLCTRWATLSYPQFVIGRSFNHAHSC